MKDLWFAVDQLTQPYGQKLERDDGAVWVRMPSLLRQLQEAVMSLSGGNGRAKQGSRPPLDIAAMSLMFEIVSCTSEALTGFDIKHSAVDVENNIRSLASELLRHPDEPDAIDWWTAQLRNWCGQVRATISNEPERPKALWGIKCPECGEKFIYEPDRDGEPVKRPAVFVHWTRELVRAVECRVCGSVWYRGEELDQLVDRMRGAA